MMESEVDRYAAGLEVRRAVLGDDYVEQALNNANALSEPLQKLVTEYCWGEVWTREGLDRRTRSLLNIAMLAVMNRPDELKIHLRGALRNRCTLEEMRETILQVAIYAGVPAAMEAMRHLRALADAMEENEPA